jgi:predicted lipoprotein with Yx(FWY)xxD motif
MTRTTYAFGLLLASLALLVAGCGGGSSSESSSTTGGGAGTTEASPEAGGAVLTSAEVSGLGAVLVDSEGLTVYEFGKDQGTTSSCYGECEKAWPPVISKGQPTAGEGASASELGTTERKDGSLQVTYAGHPLYTFVEDQAPGEANGNGSEAFGGQWWALDESGSAVEGTAGGGEEAESEGGGAGGYSGY